MSPHRPVFRIEMFKLEILSHVETKNLKNENISPGE